MLRTADGLGISKVYMSGYTPYPKSDGDERLPHEAARADRAIQKTALDAAVSWRRVPNLTVLIEELKQEGYKVVALEQTPQAVDIKDLPSQDKIALIVGSEVGGIEASVLKLCDLHAQIPMSGQKESFNVAVAAALALYQIQKLAN